MLETVKCDNCGTDDCSKLYIDCFPITITDTTMVFEKTKCECCNSKENYRADVNVNFCSYKCFWEWSQKNMPKVDEKPLDRLKKYVTPTKYATKLTSIYHKMFGKRPPNRQDNLTERAVDIIKEITKKYNINDNGIESIGYDVFNYCFDVYAFDVDFANIVIADLKKDYSDCKFVLIDLSQKISD